MIHSPLLKKQTEHPIGSKNNETGWGSMKNENASYNSNEDKTNGIEVTENFEKEPLLMDALKVFKQTDKGKSFLQMFEPGGELEDHQLILTAKKLGGKTFGNTALYILNDKGKAKPFEDQILTRETKFILQIELSPKEFEKWNKKGWDISADTTIGHEVFVHGEVIANLLKEFEVIRKIKDEKEFEEKMAVLEPKLALYRIPYTPEEIKVVEDNEKKQHASMLDDGTSYSLYLEQLKKQIMDDPELDETTKQQKLDTIDKNIEYEKKEMNENK